MEQSDFANSMAWHSPMSTFADPMSSFMQLPTNDGQDEDWEDWLRWDPSAEANSPEDGTDKSSSSKHHSPIQEHAFPVHQDIFAKSSAHETLAPPLIVGEHMVDFDSEQPGQNDATDMFLFGNGIENGSDFDFQAADTLPPLQPAAETAPAIRPTISLPTALDTTTPDSSLLTPMSVEQTQHHYSPIPPPTATTLSWQHSSPNSSTQGRTYSSSNSSASPTNESEAPVKKRAGRKRKADQDRESIDEQEQGQDQAADPTADGEEPPVKKTSHNVIEKRYRNNLNDKIVELRNSVPSLRALGRANGGEGLEDLEGLTPAHKLNKATVMGKATEYIKHLEKRNKTMSDEMAALKARLAAVEAAVNRPHDTLPIQHNNVRLRQASAASQGTASSMLGVPQDAMRYAQSVVSQPSPYTTPAHTSAYGSGSTMTTEAPSGRGRSTNGQSGGMMNKVMMGAMAGLMVMEGFTEQQNDANAMAAAPVELIRRGLGLNSQQTAPIIRLTALPLLKMGLILAVLAHLLLPLISFTPKTKKKTRSNMRLPPAPSPASPVEVRRNAWLTAVQTVYERKHFLLEVVSVTFKMALLSARRLIGSETYCSLTGTNKEEEAARIKAWDIALDAQLAGGDAEISYYRLLLTLMVSGILPDSPTRLMQKAVHFRVFFWEVANAGYGNILGFRQLTERVGKFYWDSARRLQRDLVSARSQGRHRDDDDDGEILPEHLASLLELDSEEVLNDEMIQRAWNLAWNKPSAYETTANAARDGVVEDHAIRSPLDAVAAWYANMTIDEALLDTLGGHPSTWDADYCIGIAVSVAPPASATQGRALAAKAVMSNMNRDANVIAALDALPNETFTNGNMNLVNHAPASPDVCNALTLAKLLTLFGPSASGLARVRGQEMLARMRFVPSSFTLLSAVAVYRLLKIIGGDRRLSPVAMYSVEDMAASLRIWIGTSTAQQSGLVDHEAACGKLVDACLDVARKFGGWDEQDSGYGSAESSPSRSRTSTIMQC